MRNADAQVKPKQKLEGKSNYLAWSRNFKKAARVSHVLELLEGEEKTCETEPRVIDFLEEPDIPTVRRKVRERQTEESQIRGRNMAGRRFDYGYRSIRTGQPPGRTGNKSRRYANTQISMHHDTEAKMECKAVNENFLFSRHMVRRLRCANMHVVNDIKMAHLLVFPARYDRGHGRRIPLLRLRPTGGGQ